MEYSFSTKSEVALSGKYFHRKRIVKPSKVAKDIHTDHALCEELTRTAATLVAENENLKREKELALKEYESLETTNKNLKTQIAKSTNTEVEKTPVEPVSSVAEITLHPDEE
ncbi:hypothetical protein JHK85_022932 [Glycine max]|nr:hypothetical protein JHK85_022932 [Glycine max]